MMYDDPDSCRERDSLREDWMVCPFCDELVPRNEMDEHSCPIEELEDP